jgi:PIN domain nuclease of toxin-antitoxin system
LSRKAKELIEDPQSDIHVSTVSFGEILIKWRIKKLTWDGIEPEELLDLALQMDFKTISLDPAEAITYHLL